MAQNFATDIDKLNNQMKNIAVSVKKIQSDIKKLEDVSLMPSGVISRDKELMFNAVFLDASAVAGNYIGYIKNTSTTKMLVIESIRFGSVNAVKWKIATATGTATGGNTVTAVNMNRSSTVVPEATILADNIGGFTPGTPLIAQIRNGANGSASIDFTKTLILKESDAIAFEYDTGTTGEAAATLRFYYVNI
jgi:hypothetical protein